MDESASTLEQIVERLRLRAEGQWQALDGLWADETVFWHAYDGQEIRLSGGSRAEVSKAEHEAFERALVDFSRKSIYHVSPSTDCIIEVAEFSGTTHNGELVTNPVCLIYTVEQGKIARLDIFDDASKSRKMAEILAHSLLGDASFGQLAATEPSSGH